MHAATHSPDDTIEIRPFGDALRRGGGVLRWSTFRASGLTWRAVRDRVRSGEFVRTQRSVYASAALPRTHANDVRIALASRRSNYFAAHQSAAFLHGLLRFAPQEIHIGRSTTWGERTAIDGVKVHRLPTVSGRDLTEVDGIRVTTVERTLVDLAACARTTRERRLLRFALKAALKEDDGLATRLRDRLSRSRPTRGTKLLRDALAEWAVTGHARSLLEVEFIEFCQAFDIPLPRMNVVVAGSERDAAWFDAMLLAEIDTRTHHDDDVAFQEDRDRRNAAVDAGWRLVQITPRSIGRDAPKTAALIHRLLAQSDRAGMTPAVTPP